MIDAPATCDWVRSGTIDEAAAEVNFNILTPTGIQTAIDLDHVSIRREGPPLRAHPAPKSTVWSNWCAAHTSSLCYPISLKGSVLRCKQYVYDLGPLSTLDSAALYDQSGATMTSHRLSGGRMAWAGIDYAGAPAVTCIVNGTNVELRGVAGAFDLGRTLDIADGLVAGQTQRNAPFSQRTYWSRYPRYDLNMPRSIYRPPSSLWRFRWPWLSLEHHWTDSANKVAFCHDLETLFAPEWSFDGVCYFGDPECPPETVVRFSHTKSNDSAVMWVRRLAPHPSSIPAPNKRPALESHSGFDRFEITETVSHGLRVFSASRTVNHGPHDTVFWHGPWGYLVQQSALGSGDLTSHLQSVENLTKALVSQSNGPKVAPHPPRTIRTF